SRTHNRGPGVQIRSPPPEVTAWRQYGYPKFLGHPGAPAPCSWTPARPTYQAITVGRHGPTYIQPRRLSTRGNFGARSHGIGTRCLRFAVRIAPRPRKTRFWLLASSTRRDWLP